MENKLPDFDLNGTNLVQMVWKRKITLTIITVIALIASTIVAFLITPTFQSSATLIPAKATQTSKDVFVPTRPYGLTVFGEDEEVEHLLQVLSSESLRHTVIEKENLFENYEIDPNSLHAWTEVNSKFASNVSFSRSQYRTVRISAFDVSPQKAASITNTVVTVADSLMRKTKSDLSKIALKAATKQYDEAMQEHSRLSDSLSKVMSQGALDIPYQAKEITKVYAEAIASGNTTAANRLSNYMKQLAEHGGEYTRLSYDILNKSKQIVDMQESLHFLKLEAEGTVPSQFVIDWATPSDKKAKPKKLSIIIVSTLSALFFAIFLLVLVDFFRTSIYPPKVSEK